MILGRGVERTPQVAALDEPCETERPHRDHRDRVPLRPGEQRQHRTTLRAGHVDRLTGEGQAKRAKDLETHRRPVTVGGVSLRGHHPPAHPPLALPMRPVRGSYTPGARFPSARQDDLRPWW